MTTTKTGRSYVCRVCGDKKAYPDQQHACERDHEARGEKPRATDSDDTFVPMGVDPTHYKARAQGFKPWGT
jgi:hypothetical protein